MAKELLVSTTTGDTIYAMMRVPTGGDNIGKWANIVDQTLDDYEADDFAKYALAMKELGASGFYEGDMPNVVKTKVITVEVIYFQQSGSSPAESDTKLSASLYEFGSDWVATTSLSI